jgi:polysaccharide pyruvyl transferase WcaK-like protein
MDSRKVTAARAVGNKKLFIYGYFGAGNIGDELILTAFLTMLDSRGAKFEVIIAVDNFKFYDAARYKTDFINLDISFIQRHKNPLDYEILKSFKASRAFIIPGGGIFQDYNPLSFLCYYSFLLCSKIFGVKNYLLYQGLTGINGRAARKLFALAAGCLIDYISVRDAGSVRFLSETRFGGGDCFRDYCDSVFSLKAVISKEIKTAVPSGAAVGFSLRPWKGIKPSDIAKVLTAIIQRSGRKIKLYSMHKGVDCAFNAEVAAALDEKTRSNIILVEYSNDIIKLARSIHANVINIGMRFHFSVLSMCAGAACIGLAYDEKVSELYRAANLQQLCLSGREFEEAVSGEAAPLLIRIEYAIKNGEWIKSAAGSYAESCLKRAGNIFDDFYQNCLS